MFCSKCGKEIDDNAVVCTGCGCPTANYGNAPQSSAVQQFAAGGVQTDPLMAARVREYCSQAGTAQILSIIGLLFSMGIGIILTIISSRKINNLPVFNDYIDDPMLRMEFEKAQKKIDLAKKLNLATIALFVGSIVIGFFIGFFSAL